MWSIFQISFQALSHKKGAYEITGWPESRSLRFLSSWGVRKKKFLQNWVDRSPCKWTGRLKAEASSYSSLEVATEWDHSSASDRSRIPEKSGRNLIFDSCVCQIRVMRRSLHGRLPELVHWIVSPRLLSWGGWWYRGLDFSLPVQRNVGKKLRKNSQTWAWPLHRFNSCSWQTGSWPRPNQGERDAFLISLRRVAGLNLTLIRLFCWPGIAGEARKAIGRAYRMGWTSRCRGLSLDYQGDHWRKSKNYTKETSGFLLLDGTVRQSQSAQKLWNLGISEAST